MLREEPSRCSGDIPPTSCTEAAEVSLAMVWLSTVADCRKQEADGGGGGREGVECGVATHRLKGGRLAAAWLARAETVLARWEMT